MTTPSDITFDKEVKVRHTLTVVDDLGESAPATPRDLVLAGYISRHDANKRGRLLIEEACRILPELRPVLSAIHTVALYHEDPASNTPEAYQAALNEIAIATQDLKNMWSPPSQDESDSPAVPST